MWRFEVYLSDTGDIWCSLHVVVSCPHSTAGDLFVSSVYVTNTDKGRYQISQVKYFFPSVCFNLLWNMSSFAILYRLLHAWDKLIHSKISRGRSQHPVCRRKFFGKKNMNESNKSGHSTWRINTSNLVLSGVKVRRYQKGETMAEMCRGWFSFCRKRNYDAAFISSDDNGISKRKEWLPYFTIPLLTGHTRNINGRLVAFSVQTHASELCASGCIDNSTLSCSTDASLTDWYVIVATSFSFLTNKDRLKLVAGLMTCICLVGSRAGWRGRLAERCLTRWLPLNTDVTHHDPP